MLSNLLLIANTHFTNNSSRANFAYGRMVALTMSYGECETHNQMECKRSLVLIKCRLHFRPNTNFSCLCIFKYVKPKFFLHKTDK